jgi:hypothetical protein
MTADLSTDLSELLRLILNMIRVGSVVDIDYDAQRVRVSDAPSSNFG